MKPTTSALTIATLTLTAALSGCVLIDPTDPYAGEPFAWANTGDLLGPRPDEGSPLGEGRGQVEVEGPLTLEQAVRIALANNPEIAARAQEVEAASAGADYAFGEALPRLGIDASYAHSLDDQRLLPPSENGQTGTFGADLVAGGVTLRVPLFTGGRIMSQVKAAEFLTTSARHGLGRSRESLVFNVANLYFSILAQQHVAQSLEFNQRALQRHLERVENLIAAKKAARVDRLRTEVRLANVARDLVFQRNLEAKQREGLANLLGLGPVHSRLEVSGVLTATPQALLPETDAIRAALGQRKDLMAAQAALEAQAKAVDAARAAQWPTLYGVGAYGGRWALDPSQRPSGSHRSDDVGQIGVVAEFPIFQGGQIRARIRGERAKLSSQRARLRALALEVQLEVRIAILDANAFLEQIRATETAVQQATESLRIEREKYEHGKGSTTDVLDSQSALLLTQTNRYAALAAYNVALARYRLAVGDPLK